MGLHGKKFTLKLLLQHFIKYRFTDTHVGPIYPKGHKSAA
jgi:hypothetical protein